MLRGAAAPVSPLVASLCWRWDPRRLLRLLHDQTALALRQILRWPSLRHCPHWRLWVPPSHPMSGTSPLLVAALGPLGLSPPVGTAEAEVRALVTAPVTMAARQPRPSPSAPGTPARRLTAATPSVRSLTVAGTTGCRAVVVVAMAEAAATLGGCLADAIRGAGCERQGRYDRGGRTGHEVRGCAVGPSANLGSAYRDTRCVPTSYAGPAAPSPRETPPASLGRSGGPRSGKSAGVVDPEASVPVAWPLGVSRAIIGTNTSTGAAAGSYSCGGNGSSNNSGSRNDGIAAGAGRRGVRVQDPALCP